MKIVYRADTLIDANLVKGALEAEGMFAHVAGEQLTGALGELPCWNLVSVMVADCDIERALPIVRAIEAALAGPHADEADTRAAEGGLGPALA
ncbi:MAG: DUF2007 domain-containing protein [Dokdonella sp.]|uniref:putative signal transducing protein n=1 Tax=Dokdonella sp. TaxID=2291710 RepID=UPI0025C6E276|nr:DUF2007 domain-containing protein [Dokdonella sp.]MBX3701636.1 DUF2007 domain-containing protein [Dokdonella sp.]MCW5578909.1 DUF2007 domain-containing protein [Dokdonella sp.]